MRDQNDVEFPVYLSRASVLGFMAGLCALNNKVRDADGFLLELLAWAAFSPNRPKAQA